MTVHFVVNSVFPRFRKNFSFRAASMRPVFAANRRFWAKPALAKGL